MLTNVLCECENFSTLSGMREDRRDVGKLNKISIFLKILKWPTPSNRAFNASPKANCKWVRIKPLDVVNPLMVAFPILYFYVHCGTWARTQVKRLHHIICFSPNKIHCFVWENISWVILSFLLFFLFSFFFIRSITILLSLRHFTFDARAKTSNCSNNRKIITDKIHSTVLFSSFFMLLWSTQFLCLMLSNSNSIHLFGYFCLIGSKWEVKQKKKIYKIYIKKTQWK